MVVGPLIVCADTVVPLLVDAAIVVGAVRVVPCTVEVTTTIEPISDGGIALPTPVPVHCGGIERVAVFGFAEMSFA